ncbi:MAG: thioesterase family protein [bacterium]
MAKVQLELPDRFLFETELTLRAAEINYAGHLGNDTLLSLLQEARIRFLEHFELEEMNMFGLGLVITDSMAVYESEAFRGERLRIEVTVADFNKYGCDFLYRVTEATSGRAVARAKTGMVFFDYEQRKVRSVPGPFRLQFEKQREP